MSIDQKLVAFPDDHPLFHVIPVTLLIDFTDFIKGFIVLFLRPFNLAAFADFNMQADDLFSLEKKEPVRRRMEQTVAWMRMTVLVRRRAQRKERKLMTVRWIVSVRGARWLLISTAVTVT
ncbi:hypothetical protein F2Q69_00025889 [Brassica cretica]|uniref:Uncharacterized protein n=1 Tax=Brassica cretica TaxID=69181 RepID=A0A8S9S8B2_BRACR|nr:hypothetical protein F2Q69_00025889 [Brassica cretica]